MPAALKLLDHVRVVRCDEVVQHFRAAGGEPAFGAENVLVRDRHAGERPGIAGGDAGVGGGGFGQRLFGIHRDEGIDRWIQRGDAVEILLGEFAAGNLLAGELRGERGKSTFLTWSYSMTLGTRYRPFSTAGATAWKAA